MQYASSKVRLVLICLFACALAASCGAFGPRQSKAPTSSKVKKEARKAPTPSPEERAAYGARVKLGTLEDASIGESSGVAASRANPGVFWTHNDSGDGPLIYAFDREGRKRGTWRVAGASARDWEDIAIGPGPEAGRSYLYIGDIGDNDYERGSIVIYRVAEPLVTPADAASTKAAPRETAAAESIRVSYPDGAHDAETLMVHPQTGDIYILAKSLDPAAGVYKLVSPKPAAESRKLARVGELSAPGATFRGFFTGGAISPDGNRVVVCDYLQAYELVLPAGSGFDAIWTQKLMVVDLGEREQGEAVCYTPDSNSIVATNEGRHAAIIEVRRSR